MKLNVNKVSQGPVLATKSTGGEGGGGHHHGAVSCGTVQTGAQCSPVAQSGSTMTGRIG